jgi:hypothetical protein
MYVLSWRALQRVRRSLLAVAPSEQHDEMLVFARMLQIALVGNAVSGFFLSMSYSTLLWILFAVVIAGVALVNSILAAGRTSLVKLSKPEDPVNTAAHGGEPHGGENPLENYLDGARPRKKKARSSARRSTGA